MLSHDELFYSDRLSCAFSIWMSLANLVMYSKENPTPQKPLNFFASRISNESVFCKACAFWCVLCESSTLSRRNLWTNSNRIDICTRRKKLLWRMFVNLTFFQIRIYFQKNYMNLSHDSLSSNKIRPTIHSQKSEIIYRYTTADN